MTISPNKNIDSNNILNFYISEIDTAFLPDAFQAQLLGQNHPP
jgi:hypothetical protein